jgi:hypothetical protein
VTQLLGDDPGLQAQAVKRVAGAEVAQLVEVHAVLGVECEPLVQVMAGGSFAMNAARTGTQAR